MLDCLGVGEVKFDPKMTQQPAIGERERGKGELRAKIEGQTERQLKQKHLLLLARSLVSDY